LTDVTALLASFAFVTAFGLSCAVPTLFLASWLTAAKLVPPSDTRSAIQATIIAGDGRRGSLRMMSPFRVLAISDKATQVSGGRSPSAHQALRFPYPVRGSVTRTDW
jgi:hypothetical protein